jgi:hypothetical protein
MKKFLLMAVFMVLLFGSSKAFSQQMYFCTDIDDMGNPIQASSRFIINKSTGSYFYVLVKLPYEVGTTSVRYDFYSLNADLYSETFESSVVADTKPGYTWFWSKINFYEPKIYKVYAYDAYNNLLASGQVSCEY